MTVLSLPLPPLANRYWRMGHGHLYRSKAATDYKSSVFLRGRVAKQRCETGPVILTVRVYRKRRAGDLDGYLKVLLDALQGVAYEDDKQITQIVATLEPVDKVNPRVEVTVSEAPAEVAA